MKVAQVTPMYAVAVQVPSWSPNRLARVQYVRPSKVLELNLVDEKQDDIPIFSRLLYP